jgi:hypothetical protein
MKPGWKRRWTKRAPSSPGRPFFTHPDLTTGDIVFFTYLYTVPCPNGETEIEYYESRYVVEDTADGKFYKGTFSTTNGVPSLVATEV